MEAETPCETYAAIHLTTLRYIPEGLYVYYPRCGISNIVKKKLSRERDKRSTADFSTPVRIEWA